MANEVGYQCWNCTFSNPLLNEGLNVTSLYESCLGYGCQSDYNVGHTGCHVEPMYRSSSTR